MKKLNKSFKTTGFTVESMSCAAACYCTSGCNCECRTVSDYAGYMYVSQSSIGGSNYSAVQTSVYNETYEMHYLG